MGIVEHLISDLYLCRISGYNYCEQQLEDQLFKQYFSHKKYLINNEVIAIITSDWNCHRSGGSTIESGNSSNSIGLLCHHVDVCNTYYYFVDKIVLDDSTVIITNTNGSGNSRVGEDTIIGNSSVSDSNSSGNCYSNNGEITSENTVDKYYTLPTSTNVLLSPPKQVRIYKSVIDKAVEKAVASLYTKHCPKVLAIPVTSCMCSNAPKYLSIDVRKRNCSNSNNVNDSSNSVGDNSSGCCHVNSGCSSSCKHISRYYSEAAKRIISEVGYVQNLDKFSLSIGLELISQPLLLELCSVSHTQEVGDILAATAEMLGIGLLHLDIRILHKYPVPYKTNNLYECKSVSSSLRVKYLSSNSVQEIIANAPCILHIESADLIYEELSVMATASAGMMQSATTVEDVIYSNLQQFLYDLYEELTNKVQKQHVSLNDCFIIVMLSCTSWSKMSENMKSLFPLTIKVTVNDSFVNYLDSFVQLEEKIMAQRENNWKETSSSMHIVEQSSEKHPFSSMFQHSLSKIRSIIDEKGKNSFLYCNTLINSVQYAHLTRIHKDKWFSNCGFDDLLSEKDSNHKSNDDSVDLKECAIRDVAIAVESSLFLNSYQSMEVKGIYSIDSKASSNVAPVFWSDIGGLDRVRKEILDVLELPFKYPELHPPGCPRRQGVLLYGPPGTGKTLVAKAVATECNMSFLSIKGPELLDAYVGESERNVREVFERARATAPCVLFFDEIDSLAPARAKGSDSGGGVMDRIVSQLLTEMDSLMSIDDDYIPATTLKSEGGKTRVVEEKQSLESNKVNELWRAGIIQEQYLSDVHMDEIYEDRRVSTKLSPMNTSEREEDNSNNVLVSSKKNPQSKMIFIIAATNRPDLLDPALLRPGRFDRRIYLGVSKDKNMRSKIFEAQTRKYKLSSDVNFSSVVESLPDGVTGADIGSVSVAAFDIAMQRKIKDLTALALGIIKSDCGGRDILDVDNLFSEENCWKIKAYLAQLNSEELTVIVSQTDFLSAARECKATAFDSNYYDQLEKTYDNL